jgi:hypothetical protein
MLLMQRDTQPPMHALCWASRKVIISRHMSERSENRYAHDAVVASEQRLKPALGAASHAAAHQNIIVLMVLYKTAPQYPVSQRLTADGQVAQQPQQRGPPTWSAYRLAADKEHTNRARLPQPRSPQPDSYRPTGSDNTTSLTPANTPIIAWLGGKRNGMQCSRWRAQTSSHALHAVAAGTRPRDSNSSTSRLAVWSCSECASAAANFG